MNVWKGSGPAVLNLLPPAAVSFFYSQLEASCFSKWTIKLFHTRSTNVKALPPFWMFVRTAQDFTITAVFFSVWSHISLSHPSKVTVSSPQSSSPRAWIEPSAFSLSACSNYKRILECSSDVKCWMQMQPKWRKWCLLTTKYTQPKPNLIKMDVSFKFTSLIWSRSRFVSSIAN